MRSACSRVTDNMQNSNTSPSRPKLDSSGPGELERSNTTLNKLFLQGIYEVWGEGQDMAELQRSIETCSADKLAAWCSPDLTFKVAVDGWGQTLTQEQQVELIEQMAFLPIQVRYVKVFVPLFPLWPLSSTPNIKVLKRHYLASSRALTSKDFLAHRNV